MDTTEKVIVGICSLLAAGGLALWLSDDAEVADQRELQPAPLAEEERGQPRQPERSTERDRRNEPDDQQVDPVQAAGDILTSVLKGGRGSGDNKPQEGRSGDSAPADSRPDTKTQTTEKIPVRQPVELQATSETEPIRAESYSATDPYCDLPPSNVATAQGAAYTIHAAVRGSVKPVEWEEEKRFGDAVFKRLRDDDDSPLRGHLDRPGSEGDRTYVERLLTPILKERGRKELAVTVHIVDKPGERNAAMMVGGHMLVFKELLQTSGKMTLRSEAELVAVLAHEVAHADLRHLSLALDLLRQAGAGDRPDDILNMGTLAMYKLLTQIYSRELEDEADRYSVERLFRLAYSPYEFARLWKRWDQDIDSPISGNRPITSAELDRAMLEGHSPPRVRACKVRELITELEPRSSVTRFYIGRRNLSERKPRSDAQY